MEKLSSNLLNFEQEHLQLLLTHRQLLHISEFACLAALIYCVSLTVFRLFLCPIAKFPGPRIAAATYWYEFYFDVIKRGKYADEIDRLHQIYGPVLRINPHEIHVNDPDFYHTLYVEAPIRKSHKWKFAVGGVNLPGALPLTPDHNLHRIRRKAMNQFFSKQSVLRLEPVVQKEVKKLCSRIREYKGKGKPVNMNNAFAALAGDVVSTFCFARNYKVLDEPDFAPEWEDVAVRFSQLVHLFNQFPSLIRFMRKVPRQVMAFFDPRIILFFNREDMFNRQISDIKLGKDMLKSEDHATIFHDLIYNSKLPPEEISVDRLRDEGSGVVGAGTVTTARTLYVTTYFVLAQREIFTRLREELREPFADFPSHHPIHAELEKLPYLTAVIHEGLRLAYGAVHRLGRVFPDTTMEYGGWKMPPGTAISMSARVLHENPDIFPEPQKFVPDRWLTEDKEEQLKYRKYFVPFSKGSRNCVGLNLAWAELYHTIAMIFMPGGVGDDMELFKTTEEDVLCAHDFYAASARVQSKGVRVVLN